MGSPISSILAVFKLRPLEEHILKKHFPRPTLWLRYVDDMFVIWEDGMQSLENFFDEINQIDNFIKFTMELERINSLPFLDVFLVKENNCLKWKVFRKAMKLGSVIPVTAADP